ncbi:hypothetical protein HG531_012925 [Fusarium graminearum]|nr:hypothetical protein HG531_012925 [Fusarium graminearum]
MGFDGFSGGGKGQVANKDNMTVGFAVGLFSSRFCLGRLAICGCLCGFLLLVLFLVFLRFVLGFGIGIGTGVLWLLDLGLLFLLLVLLCKLFGICSGIGGLVVCAGHWGILGIFDIVVLFGEIL